MDKYIGIPFKPNGRDHNGVDCWGLVCLIYQDKLGVRLPSYDDIYTANSISVLRRVARTMASERYTWVRVERPMPYDIVLLRSGEYLWHVGLIIDKRRMIHALDGDAVCIEEYTSLYWKDRIVEFRHYAG